MSTRIKNDPKNYMTIARQQTKNREEFLAEQAQARRDRAATAHSHVEAKLAEEALAESVAAAVFHLNQALAGTPLVVRSEDDVIIFEHGRTGESYRFPEGYHHRVDAFVYGVRLGLGRDAWCNEGVAAVVELKP